MIETSSMKRISEWIEGERPMFTKTKNYRYENNSSEDVFFSNIKNFTKVDDNMKFTVETEKPERKSPNCWRAMLVSFTENCLDKYEYVFALRGIRKRNITLTLPNPVLLEVGNWYTLRMESM